MKIVFAGLGVMGAPMARHLVNAKHEVIGFNRSINKAKEWSIHANSSYAEAVEQAVIGADALIMCLGNDDDVKNVVMSALPHMRQGSIIIDHTTTSAKLAVEISEVTSSKKIEFCDSPVSGGEVGAINGALTIMVGCSKDVFARVTDLVAPYTKAITRIGEPGAGQRAKMANQIAIAGVVQGLAEAIHFCKSASLEPALVFDAISQGAAGSWQMANRWKSMVDGRYDFGFAVDWMRKDLGLVLDEASGNGAKLELTRMVDGYYAEIQAMGGERWDTSSLLARLERSNEAN